MCVLLCVVYFRDVNRKRAIVPAPIRPIVNGPEDHNNFDEFEDSDEESDQTIQDRSFKRTFEQQDLAFIGYTYNSFGAFGDRFGTYLRPQGGPM